LLNEFAVLGVAFCPIENPAEVRKPPLQLPAIPMNPLFPRLRRNEENKKNYSLNNSLKKNPKWCFLRFF